MTTPAPVEDLGALDLDALRERLRAARFTSDAVRERLGECAQAALGRNTTVAAARALAGAAEDDAQATLTRLWILQRPVARRALEHALGEELLAQLLRAGVLDEHAGGELGARLELRPYAFEDDPDPAAPASTTSSITSSASPRVVDAWFFSDLTPGLDGPPGPLAPDHVLGVTPASTSLTTLTMPITGRRALDLGTGCGIQALHLARRFDTVVATDLNPRALAFARANLALNQVGERVDLRRGSFYEPVADERFDLIVSNPPYVMAPPREASERLAYREGEHRGDGLVRHVLSTAPAHLEPGASVQVLGNWAHLVDTDWRERLAGWAPPGCTLQVWQRERLSPEEYVEIWLADAGLTGSPQWAEQCSAWLDYLDEERIEAVGMGWLLLTRTDATPTQPTPSVESIEAWPHAVEQPVGPALLAERDARRLAALAVDDLLARHWTLRPDVISETTGRPGAADPEHVVLRQRRGLCRAVEVDTALGGVLGACDGELSLGAIVIAVAALLELDAAALTDDLVPGLRRAVAHDFLRPT